MPSRTKTKTLSELISDVVEETGVPRYVIGERIGLSAAGFSYKLSQRCRLSLLQARRLADVLTQLTGREYTVDDLIDATEQEAVAS